MLLFKKTLLNAKVNLLFSVVTLFLAFYSRKVFIEALGDNLIGLNATISNILGFLNIAELGVSTAISFLLYKPLHDNDNDKLKEIVSVFAYYYRRIGLFILCAGVILSFFLPLIFSSSSVPLTAVYASFFTFLFSSLIGYFLNYKQVLLTADQKNYVVVAYINAITIGKVILQMLVVTYSTGNFYLYLFLEILFACFISILLNSKIRKEYPWLQSSSAEGKVLRAKYPAVITKTKQLFSHSFAGFILLQTDQLLIFSFASLSMVTVFSNYTLIIQKLLYFIDLVLISTSAGVGNLIATNDDFRIKKVFGELMALRYWLAGIVIFCLYHLTPSFIKIWLGPSYILNQWAFYLMLVNVYIMITRQTIQSFLIGYGLFKDVWAPWVEAILNIAFSIALAFYYGITGILLGSTISLILIVVLWKPYFLYKEGFKEHLSDYWKVVSSYIVQFLISGFLITIFLKKIVIIEDGNNFYHWTLKALVVTFSFSLVYGLSMYLTSSSMRNLKIRLMSIIPKPRFLNT